MEFLKSSPKWTRQPKEVKIDGQKVIVTTEKGTDLWARTYYGFQNDNAPVFQIETSEKYFSFVVKTEFESSCRFDQCGVLCIWTVITGLRLLLNMKMRRSKDLGVS